MTEVLDTETVITVALMTLPVITVVLMALYDRSHDTVAVMKVRRSYQRNGSY